MKQFKVKCVRNDSSCLPYVDGEIYTAQNEGKGLLIVFDGKGDFIQCPRNGYYLDFEEIK